MIDLMADLSMIDLLIVGLVDCLDGSLTDSLSVIFKISQAVNNRPRMPVRHCMACKVIPQTHLNIDLHYTITMFASRFPEKKISGFPDKIKFVRI